MATRLNRDALKQLQAKKTQDPDSLSGVVLPQYDPSNISASIVHFGPSNFARAHLAVYAQKLIEKGHADCGIIAVSPKLAESAKLTDKYNDMASNRTVLRAQALAAQDNLFSVWVKDGQTDRVDVVGSITDVVLGPLEADKVIKALSSESTKLVTMTVTQNGYYFRPTNPGSESESPEATVEYLVLALDARMKAGLPSFGVMSLDNFERNADSVRNLMLKQAAEVSKELRDWIAKETPFYSTMVDRIVPQPTEGVVLGVSNRLGFNDAQALATEPYMHLVIGRSPYGPKEMREPPIALDKVGAVYVDEVEPHELAKLRILNGAHMALGVVGRLSGETFADDALKKPELKEFVNAFIEQVVTTLPELDGVDYNEYRLKTIQRMENPFLHDELARLARNGTEKIKTRFLSPLHDAYAQDLPREHIIMALAAWVKYVASANKDGSLKVDTDNDFFINDPKAYQDGIVDVCRNLNGDITPILSTKSLFEGLENNRKFVRELSAAYRQISGYGQTPSLEVESSPFAPPEVA